MRSVLAVAATAPVWFALAHTTTYEPGTYLPLDGFAASHHVWLALAAACAGALALARRGNAWPVAGVLAGVLAVRVAIAAFTPPDPIDPVVAEPDCSNHNVPLGCRLGNALSVLDSKRSQAQRLMQLRTMLNLATELSAAVLVAILVWPKPRSS